MCQASNTWQLVSAQEGHVTLLYPLYTSTHMQTHTDTYTMRSKEVWAASAEITVYSALQWAAPSCLLLPLEVSRYNQQHWRWGTSWRQQQHEHFSVTTLLSPEILKVGQQQQNIMFSWPSPVMWAGMWEFLECSVLVASVSKQLWAYHPGIEVTFSRFQPLGPFLQSDLSRTPSCYMTAYHCHRLHCTSWAKNSITTTLSYFSGDGVEFKTLFFYLLSQFCVLSNPQCLSHSPQFPNLHGGRIRLSSTS